MVQIIKTYLGDSPKIRRLVKFGIVGITCIFIDFIVVFCFFELIGIDKFIANIMSSVITVVSNYLLNRFWTFRSTNPWKKEFSKFITFASIGTVISNLIVRFSTKILSSLTTDVCNDYMKIKLICAYPEKSGFYFAKVLAIGIVFFWNFFVNSKFNFKND